LKKIWVAALLFLQGFFTIASVRVLAAVLVIVTGGEVEIMVE